MEGIIEVLIGITIVSVSLWIMLGIFGKTGTLKQVFIAVVGSQLCIFIPYIGGVLSIIVFFYLICTLTKNELWPTGIIITIFGAILQLALLRGIIEVANRLG